MTLDGALLIRQILMQLQDELEQALPELQELVLAVSCVETSADS